MARLLIVEDDRRLRDALADFFQDAGRDESRQGERRHDMEQRAARTPPGRATVLSSSPSSQPSSPSPGL